MKVSSCLVLTVAMMLTASARAAEQKFETFTDPTKAGIDYKIQGEYAGPKLGVQIVALGKGTFRAVFLAGGLPGDGWNGTDRVEVPGKLEGEKATFAAEAYSATATGEVLSGQDAKGGKFELKKVVRRSPAEGAKSPAGATVLFDGTEPKGLTTAKKDERGFLAAGFDTTKKYGSFTLHVEFMLPFMPDARGQARANSGIYMQKRYEIQVLDSFGLVAKNNDCASVYTQVKPLLNMCYPPLSWQTYDIDFTQPQWDGTKKAKNAHVTVKQNGVIVQDNTEIVKKTGAGAPESPEPGIVNFQYHNNPVVFRNIWIVEK